MRACVYLLYIVLFSTSVFSDGQTLRAAFFEANGWGQEDENGNITGVLPDLADAISVELGMPIQKVVVPYPRMLKMIETGYADFAIFFQSEVSQNLAHQLVKFYNLDTTLVVKKNLLDGYNKTSRKMRIAVMRGLLFDHPFDTSKDYEKILANGHTHATELMIAGRVDGVAGLTPQVVKRLNNTGPELNQFQIIEILNSNQSWLQFSKRSLKQNRIEALKRAALKVKENGTATAIFDTYWPGFNN